MQSLSKSALNPTFGQMWLHEALFWTHFLIIIGAVLMGLVLPWQVATGAIILHRLHLKFFDDCAFSRLQRKVGGLNHADSYLQQLTKRLFNHSLKTYQLKTVDRSLVALSIAVIIAANLNLSHIVTLAIVVAISMFGATACLLMWRSQSNMKSSATCNVNSRSTCESIKSTTYSSIFGVPVEHLGLGYFVVLILAEILRLIYPTGLLATAHAVLIAAGLLTTMTFIILQVKVLKTLCTSCLNVHGASITVAVVHATRMFI